MTDKERAKTWMKKVRAANKHFEKWERKFKCKELNEYYEGFQNKTNPDAYTLNLFYSTFAVKKPNLLFKKPIYYVDPKPRDLNFQPDIGYRKASLATDVVNFYVSTDRMGLGEQLELELIDNLSYFGVMEVGYNAKWIKNPSANKPEILEAEDT